jgi:hypothetical protein
MLREGGYAATLVTGDSRETAERVAVGAGIGRCLAGVMPLEKADLVREAKLPSLSGFAMTPQDPSRPYSGMMGSHEQPLDATTRAVRLGS